MKGKVKTRLANTVGDDKALDIYHRLLQHTRNITTPLFCHKYLYYSWFIDEEDDWDNSIYTKKLQTEGDLGSKMQSAFEEIFIAGHEKAMIIGSDCPGLSTNLIEEAFEQLNTHDVVIGPAEDGGYYLLGMKKLHPAFFQNKQWSTAAVLTDTIANIRKLQLSYKLFPTLSDVDYEEDLVNLPKLETDS